MGNFDHDNPIASMLEELPRLRDDTFWPPFPEWMRELKLLPAPERLHGKFKRHSRGIFEEDERLGAEWLYLKHLRQLQSDYKALADFLSALPRSKGLEIGAALNGSLTSVILNAFFLGQECPPEERTRKAREGRVKPWHSEALVLTASMRKKHPSWDVGEMATLVFNRLKDSPTGPKNREQVRSFLRRNWSTVQ